MLEGLGNRLGLSRGEFVARRPDSGTSRPGLLRTRCFWAAAKCLCVYKKYIYIYIYMYIHRYILYMCVCMSIFTEKDRETNGLRISQGKAAHTTHLQLSARESQLHLLTLTSRALPHYWRCSCNDGATPENLPPERLLG